MISRKTPSTNQLRCSRPKTMPKDGTTQFVMIVNYGAEPGGAATQEASTDISVLLHSPIGRGRITSQM